MFFLIYFILLSLIGMLLAKERVYGITEKIGNKTEMEIIFYSLNSILVILLFAGNVATFFYALPALWFGNFYHSIVFNAFSKKDLSMAIKNDWLASRLFLKIASNPNASKWDIASVIVLYEVVIILTDIFSGAIVEKAI